MAAPTPIAAGVPLNLPERIHLLSILPAEGDVATLRTIRDLREQLSVSEEEHEEFGLSRQVDGDKVHYAWSNREAAETPKSFAIKPRALALIADALRQLDASKKMRAELLPLYDSFVER